MKRPSVETTARPPGLGFRRLAFFLSLVTGVCTQGSERVALVWPTPNPAFSQGKGIDAFIQHAGSGQAESGCFGCVRSNGNQFHEGIDIKPLRRDRRGDATDQIVSAMDGVVRHVSARPGESSYGRYVVIEHPDMIPAVYTLYAHLSRIVPGLKAGDRVLCGQAIGTMGHSAGGYAIPKDRAHLHFEIGLWVTRDFQSWYNRRKFGSPNEQGLYNGMNLMGIDPLDFFRQWKSGRVDDFQQYFARMPVAVRVRMATRQVPDFVLRYPDLLTKERPLLVAGWEIAFNWTGLPIAWTPLTSAEVHGLSLNRPVLVEVNADIERRYRCKNLAVSRRGGWTIGRDLETVMQQLFGLR